uniref:Peptidase M24 domain-containing protein n=1 Tax=Mandrillus leucophaeus TaxID=9568 RepID=A0A2K5YFK0_MANLE
MLGRDKQQEQTIAEDLVMTKYQMASSSGVWILSLCEEGDAMIMAETGKIFKKEKEMRKGIAFPTSILVNNCVCHFSPLRSDKDSHTFVVDVAQGIQITGQKADVIKAAHLCVEAALCLGKPGNHNKQVTEAWNKVAPSFNCTPVEGMLSHQLKQHVIGGEKTIIRNPAEQQKKDHEKAEFGVFIIIGEGKAKDAGLQMQTSHAFFSEVERCFDAVSFTLRAWIGVVECTKHGLLQPFNVLYQKKGEFVDQFKFAVLLMPNGSMLMSSGPFEPDLYKSEIEVQDPELKTLLQSSSKKEKKKASKAAENATSEETLEEKEAGNWGGAFSPDCCSCLIPFPLYPRLCEVQFFFSTWEHPQSGGLLAPIPVPQPTPFQQ